MKRLLENWRRLKALNEARTLPQILHTLAGGKENIQTVGILTAENPKGKEASAEFNIEANKQLSQDLRNMNLGYRRIRGSFGSKENSFLVPNITRDEAVLLGKKYDQVSVIWGDKQHNKMIFQYITSDDGQTQERRDVVLSGREIQTRKDFYSQEPKGPEDKAGKFLVPFFDDKYEIDEELELQESQDSDPIYEEINDRINKSLQEGMTGKYRWEQRGLIKKLKKTISKKKG